MKTRKGFGKINIDGKLFLFNWADTPDGVLLIMYDNDDKKIEIPYKIWYLYPDSEEYKNRISATWHGKHKNGPEWAGWGKPEARELYLKYLTHISQK